MKDMPVGTSMFQLVVSPDTIKINGNFLQFKGISEEGKRYAVFYQLKNEEEQQKWQKIENFIEIKGTGDIAIPLNQRNLNGFDYQYFLKQQRIYRTIQVDSFSQIKKIKIFSLVGKIQEWRKQWTNRIEIVFPTVTSSYMKSLLLGIKDNEFQEIQQTMKQIGILHLFSISGMHVYFFLSFYRYILLRLGITQETVFLCELIFLVFFLVLTGVSTSVGRSVMMTALLKCNKKYRWYFSSLDCFSMVLCTHLLFQPYLLLSASGQLSYGLTFFIILMINNKKNHGLSSFLFGNCVGLLSIPICIFYFHEWNLISSLLTIVVAPLFSYVLLPILTILFLLSFFWIEIGKCFFVLKFEYALHYFQNIIAYFSEIKFFQIIVGVIPVWLYLFSLIYIMYWLSQTINRKRMFTFFLFLLCVSSVKYLNPQGMIAFVDVGQGDAIFIQLPFHQKNLLIDTGGRLAFPQETWQERKEVSSNASKTLIPFLKSRGVKKLDKVFITHSDEDHMGDLLAVNNEIIIKELYFGKGAEKKQNFNDMLKELKKTHTELHAIVAPANFSIKNMYIKLLYPLEEGEGRNDDSLVFYLKLNGTSLLLTGDLEEEGEEKLIDKYPNLTIDVLKIGHHGSKTSSSPTFIKKLQPEHSIISCGKNNRFGHPHSDVLNLLNEQKSKIYRTDEQGMIYAIWYPYKKTPLFLKTVREKSFYEK